MVTLNYRDARPIYTQIVENFRSQIAAGILQPGDKLPSVRELAAEARVNPNTVQRALTELEREGLLTGGGTTGRCVTENEETLEALRRQAVQRVVHAYALRMRELGLTAQQASDLLAQEMEE